MSDSEAQGATRILITGATGFVGGYLAAECAARGWTVFGTGHPHEEVAGSAVESVATIDRIDLADMERVRELVARVQPDHIYHLAAQASVEKAWHDPLATLHNNIDAQLSVLDAVRLECPAAKVLVISSSEVYGSADRSHMPLDETEPVGPLDPYAVSKMTQEMLGLQYSLAFGLHVVRVRPFNHMGPRQRLGFAPADFARQVALIEAERMPPSIKVGNLEAVRDLSDVRDVVRAYVLALVDGERGAVYNVASGSGISMNTLLHLFIEETEKRIVVETDPDRLRPSDRPLIIGDAGLLRARTGWTPTIPLSTTIRDTLDYWRETVRSLS